MVKFVSHIWHSLEFDLDYILGIDMEGYIQYVGLLVYVKKGFPRPNALRIYGIFLLEIL